MLEADVEMRGSMPCVVFRAEEELDFAASPVPQARRSRMKPVGADLNASLPPISDWLTSACRTGLSRRSFGEDGSFGGGGTFVLLGTP